MFLAHCRKSFNELKILIMDPKVKLNHTAQPLPYLLCFFSHSTAVCCVNSLWFSLLQLSCYKHAKQCLRRPQRIQDFFNLYIMGSPCVDAHLFFSNRQQLHVRVFMFQLMDTWFVSSFRSKDWTPFGLQLGLEGRSMIAFLTMSLAMDHGHTHTRMCS